MKKYYKVKDYYPLNSEEGITKDFMSMYNLRQIDENDLQEAYNILATGYGYTGSRDVAKEFENYSFAKVMQTGYNEWYIDVQQMPDFGKSRYAFALS